MVAKCEDELICDMAETYHVYNWRELPLRTAAILASGLPENSRTIRKLSDEKVGLDTKLRAAILDQLKFLAWTKTEDCQKGRNRPKSTLEALLKTQTNTRVIGFEESGDFLAAWKRITGGQ